MTTAEHTPRIQKLILDAAPLLTQAKISGLADNYYISPSVLAEIRDVRAREYLEHLHTTNQIQLEVREPGAEAMQKIIDFAKQTGDYAVLSSADLHVLALTYAIEVETHGTWRIRDKVGGKTGQQIHEQRRLEEKAHTSQTSVPDANSNPASTSIKATKGGHDPSSQNSLPRRSVSSSASKTTSHTTPSHPEQGQDDDQDGFTVVDADHGFQIKEPGSNPEPSNVRNQQEEQDEEDDETVGGQWITPTNITQHKNKALGMVTEESQPDQPLSSRRRRGKKRNTNLSVACMTGDFAVQNVLLQMGLRLVSVDGTRIERVKSWVLRCHACYKICKDAERKFCPSCGNATLIRTSVSASAPDHEGKQGLQVHLKPNFEYHNRGTIYSLPMPRAGSSSGGKPSGSSRNDKTGVPVLREDQPEWQRGMAKDKIRKQKEERTLQRTLKQGKDPLSARYADPDWLPDLLTGKHTPSANGLPTLGIGRKNPNERRRRRK
ncbi:20S-pre-rRNA D-site endonuclease nob1 [Malassezia yamatoensis]|uniref:20S-pre-rRNA D-site endonuclease NOB1 n=1 Tax=Malassezia yamatoensis TaxID=253288 RepID=A0AAJ5YWM4_9BASI|nr:20S-pre-rRNA D-site endonuclease nob1 [Malassezia yamatoensis]